MDSLKLLEYRPGRWAKIDAATGTFLGQATIEEVRAWKRDRNLVVEADAFKQAKIPPKDGGLTLDQPTPLAYDAPPPSPEGEPPESTPQQPVPESAAGEPTSQEPTPESPAGEPAPQEPAPASPVGEPTPEEPAPEGPAGEPAPEEPAPESPAGEPAPEEPAPESPAGEPAPQEPAPESPVGEPAPQEPAPESPAGEPTPEEPAPESPAGEPTPQEPAPESPAGEPAPEAPAPERPPGEPAPQEPVPEKEPAEPAPQPQEPGTAKTETGPAYPLSRRVRISSTFEDHKKRTPPSTAPGIDLACPIGTEVRAWAPGRVVRSQRTDAGGLSLWIQHSKAIKTYYAHLRSVSVQGGQAVSAGQKVAESGNTGHTTGPHLHFSVLRNGQYIDPQPLLPPVGSGEA